MAVGDHLAVIVHPVAAMTNDTLSVGVYIGSGCVYLDIFVCNDFIIIIANVVQRHIEMRQLFMPKFHYLRSCDQACDKVLSTKSRKPGLRFLFCRKFADNKFGYMTLNKEALPLASNVTDVTEDNSGDGLRCNSFFMVCLRCQH